MDTIAWKIKKHQGILVKWLEEEAYERNHSLGNTLENHVIADTERHHYQLIYMGWSGVKFVYGLLFHLDIKPDGKIWIQQNNTEMLIGQELVSRGVQKSDIVIGFRPEYMREGTGYAVA